MNRKLMYEEPKMQVISIGSNDVISTSSNPFFGEEDPLDITDSVQLDILTNK